MKLDRREALALLIAVAARGHLHAAMARVVTIRLALIPDPKQKLLVSQFQHRRQKLDNGRSAEFPVLFPGCLEEYRISDRGDTELLNHVGDSPLGVITLSPETAREGDNGKQGKSETGAQFTWEVLQHENRKRRPNQK